MDHHHPQVVADTTASATTSFFSEIGFMPHGHCYLWKPGLIGMHAISDLLIGLAYVVISVLLYRLVRRIQLPFSGMFLAFGAFIGFCGLTHFLEVWTLWHPDYWLSGMVKVVTAAASVATGIFLVPMGPKVEALAQAAKLSEERKIQLENTHAELEILYRKVKEADELKTQFFANVSHELRTPLALILGPAEHLIKTPQLDPGCRSAAEVIARNARTLLKQVNDLLDISKLEAGRMEPRYARIDLIHLIRVTVAHFETVMQTKGIFLSIQTPDEIEVEIDPDKIQRVLMNLISNAVKFTPDGGRIRIGVEAPNGSVSFFVSDTGPGVAPEFEKALFERFRQGEGGINRQFGGTGLGLAIVKDFVELHAGTVRFQRDQSPGATFVVTLPRKAPAGKQVRRDPVPAADTWLIQGTVDELRQSAEHPTPEQQALGKPTVLVCEDNPDMNRFVADTLRSDFNVISAKDGRDGLAKTISLRPDLVISDIMMPNMGGDILLHEIRKSPIIGHLPVLLLSARTDDDLRVRLLREGASDYVMKPFQPEELLARARNLVLLKKTREVLESELSMRSQDIVGLAESLAVRKREAQLARETAEVALTQAEKASQVRSTFLTLVSHELKTPLTSQHLSLQLLSAKENANLTDKQKKMIDRMVGSSTQLKNLIETLIEFSEIESGRLTVRSEKIEVVPLVGGVIEELQSIAEKRGLSLQSHMEPELPSLNSDPRLIRVILSQLIANALKFTERGQVDIHASHLDGRHVLTVKDTGTGISPEDQQRIFDPFLQLEPLAKKSTSGVGLGLALVKQLVDALGGEIEVQSMPGAGSTFTVFLPSFSQVV